VVPGLEGNATLVYRVAVDPAALAAGRPATGERELYPTSSAPIPPWTSERRPPPRAGIESAALLTAVPARPRAR